MNFTITSIGNIAYNILTTKNEFIFFGQTSKGIFLLSDQNNIIFISIESFKGPYTINCTNLQNNIPICSKETNIFTTNEQIIFQNPSITFSKNFKTNIFDPQLSIVYSYQQIINNIKKFIQNSNLSNNEYLVNSLQLIDLPETTKSLTNPKIQIILAIKIALQQNSEKQLFAAFTKLIGVGNGLTPSGDDFITGVILSETIIKDREFSNDFKQSLIKEMLLKTTLISANLIEAAFQKKADERILNLIKEICADEFSNIDALNQLTTWGNSSGIDTLAGIILSCQTNL